MRDKRISAGNFYGSSGYINNRMAEIQIVTKAALGGAIGTYLGFVLSKHKVSLNKKYLRSSVRWMMFLNVVLYALLLEVIRLKDQFQRSYLR